MKNKDFFKDIKVVGFDFDNTLFDEEYFIKTRWQKLLRGYASNLERTFFEIYKRKGPYYKFHLDDALNKLKMGISVKKDILSALKKADGDELPLSRAKEVLKSLKNKGLKIGIITDGVKLRQEKRLKKTGIYEFMDFIYCGKGKKEKKPDKKIIKGIFKRFKIDLPQQFLYVGNDFIEDIEGMLLSGVKACWVTNNKDAINNPNLIKIKNLKELSSYLNFK